MGNEFLHKRINYSTYAESSVIGRLTAPLPTEPTMTDLKTLDARIEALSLKITRMQNRRQRMAVREARMAELNRRTAEAQRLTLAGELLLQAVERGVLPRDTVSQWCESQSLPSEGRALLGL